MKNATIMFCYYLYVGPTVVKKNDASKSRRSCEIAVETPVSTECYKAIVRARHS
jgi:hypothetical protein